MIHLWKRSCRNSPNTKNTQHSHELAALNLNQAIFYQSPAKKTWAPGTIIGYGPETRLYSIVFTSGRILGRSLYAHGVLPSPR